MGLPANSLKKIKKPQNSWIRILKIQFVRKFCKIAKNEGTKNKWTQQITLYS